ncbi:MAG: hypothetical protein ACOCX1_03315 [Fimbriimonadaceae bacterium]
MRRPFIVGCDNCEQALEESDLDGIEAACDADTDTVNLEAQEGMDSKVGKKLTAQVNKRVGMESVHRQDGLPDSPKTSWVLRRSPTLPAGMSFNP